MNISLKSLLLFLLIPFSFVMKAQEEKSDDINFIDMYYVNKKHQKISTYSVRDKVIYLVIESTNGVGKNVDIQMNEGDPDVIYKNRFLTVDDVFVFTLKKDKQLIKFQLFDPRNKRHVRLKDEHG